LKVEYSLILKVIIRASILYQTQVVRLHIVSAITKKTVNIEWRMVDFQMLIVHNPLGVWRWTLICWNPLKMYYKIECLFVPFDEEIYWILRIKISFLAYLTMKVLEWVAIGFGLEAFYGCFIYQDTSFNT
jgi:hypothetical protein